jgi:hypothetical protein
MVVRNSGVIDIAAQPDLAAGAEQHQEVGTLGMAGTTPDQDDQSGESSTGSNRALRQGKEMTPIAAHDDPLLSLGMPENRFIPGCGRKDFLQEHDIMTSGAQQVRRLDRHVVVCEESHPGGPAICSAIRASISVRWSS